MKKKTDSTISLPVWAQLLLPVLVTVLCAGIVLLCVLIPSLRHSGWKLPRRIIAIVGFVALLAVCALVEFLLDGKIYQNMPFWFGYLTDAVCLTAAAAICCRALKAACEKE